MRFIVMSSRCCHLPSDYMTVTTRNSNKNLFVARAYVLDVFFVRDATEGDVPDRNVKALAVGSTFPLTGMRKHVPMRGLRKRDDLHISRGEQNPCLVDMPEGEGFRDVVVPERRL